ncbi:hypothetical protein L581_4372 [Serratia fonticola AU-AP2C]|nr:hypothetical protein L581_4372 [Serratia fonticola AU-AP2C]
MAAGFLLSLQQLIPHLNTAQNYNASAKNTDQTQPRKPLHLGK